MSNMFRESQNGTSPESVDDCLEQDALENHLWGWAALLENCGKVLFCLILIGGIILAFYNYINDVKAIKFFLTLLITVVSAFFEYYSFHILALLIGALSGIYQSNKRCAKFAELQTNILLESNEDTENE